MGALRLATACLASAAIGLIAGMTGARADNDVLSTHYDGVTNDLLTAGLGKTGLGSPVAPGFVIAAVSIGPKLDIKSLWLEPGEKVDLPAGAAVFAMDGRFAGLTSAVDGGTIIIPGADVLASAEELAAKVKPADAPH